MSFKRIPPFRAGLAASLLIAASGGHAASLSFAHFAPSAGEVQITVNERTQGRIDYDEVTAIKPFNPGLLDIRATRADGSLIAEGQLQLDDSDQYVVLLSGNGSEHVPFHWRKSADHNHPFIGGFASLQHANLAIVATSGASSPGGGIRVTTQCHGPTPASSAVELFGHGTGPLDTPYSADPHNLKAGISGIVQCSRQLSLLQTDEVVATSAGQQFDGARLRSFFIGDGISEPYEIRIVLQATEPMLDSIALDSRMAGLWAVQGQPQTGVHVAFDSNAEPGRQISAVQFGYASDGESSWRVLTPDPDGNQEDGTLQVVNYRGGNPDGTRAAIGFDRGDVRLVAHSCVEMSLIPDASTAALSGGMFRAFPRENLRLTKLFPQGCPESSTDRKENAE